MTDQVAASSNPEGADADAPPVASMTLTPAFKLVFMAVLCVTVGALAAQVLMAIFVKSANDPEAQNTMETCSTIAKLGFGAMVGLLGGKAV